MKNIVIVLGMLIFFSANVMSQNEVVASAASAQTNDGWDKSKIEKFVKKAANVSLMEVQAGQLALQNSTNQRVRDYAQMLIQDHTASNQKLQSVVVNMNQEVPTTLESEYQSKLEKLRNQTDDFDKEYIGQMVKDHRETISDFEDARENINDPSLRSWIDNALSMLRKHQNEAETIKDQLK